LEDGLRSPDAFVLRRAQIILASAQGEPVGGIAPRVALSGQAVRAICASGLTLSVACCAWRHMQALCRAAGVTPKGVHALRHSAGTRLYAETRDLEATAPPTSQGALSPIIHEPCQGNCKVGRRRSGLRY
jgi:hypothetical protein